MLYAVTNMEREHKYRLNGEILTAYLRDPNVRILVVWNDLSLVCPDAPGTPWLDRGRAGELTGRFADFIFLGTDAGHPVFVVDASALDGGADGPDFGSNHRFVSLRLYGPQLPAETGALLAYARAMVMWHRNNRHCGICGTPTASIDGGHVRRCPSIQCGHMTYPRTDAAVIMLVEDGDRILLHRQRQWPQGMWSCLAGFVEPGETLEAAVRREVFEESGIQVEDVRYVASQPWPFPSSLMVAFTAKATGGTLTPDCDEIEDARWFSIRDLDQFDDRNRQTGHGLFLAVTGTAARHLIDNWRKSW